MSDCHHPASGIWGPDDIRPESGVRGPGSEDSGSAGVRHEPDTWRRASEHPLTPDPGPRTPDGIGFGFLDAGARRELRRACLKALCIPGYQVPYASREMPIARGFGTGGLQISLALLDQDDVLKVIDQGADDSVNAANLRRFIAATCPGVALTSDPAEATVIQTRHRVCEAPLLPGQIMVYQVPYPDPLQIVEPSEAKRRTMHADGDYARLWVRLYEDLVRYREIAITNRYPALVAGRYVIDPSPIPRWDLPKLHQSSAIHLFGAGREKKLYAVPPFTDVQPLAFADVPFQVEAFLDETGARRCCARCGAADTYLDEVVLGDGGRRFQCSDSDWCDGRLAGRNGASGLPTERPAVWSLEPGVVGPESGVRSPESDDPRPDRVPDPACLPSSTDSGPRTPDPGPILLDVRNLGRRHGPGCPRCVDSTGDAAGTNVCPHCGSVVALAGLSFQLHPGEILGVMGESGSGKSTLAKLLHLDDRPTWGEAIWHGCDAAGAGLDLDLGTVDGPTARWLRDRRFGMVHQSPHLGLNFQVSAGGNIAERLLCAGERSFARIRERAGELLDRTEIPRRRIDDRPAAFSGGMQQRLQIARALAPAPHLLFLDEITTGLDLSVQASVLDLVLELQQRTGVAMLVVTHDLGVVRLLASRTLVLRHGRVVEQGLTDQILEDPQHPYTQQLVMAAL